MSVSLATLTARLTAAVPARNSLPSAAQYQQCVEDAVADFAARRPNQKITTLSIINGTASYALPSDFIHLISLASFASPVDGVIVTGAGLIPVSADWEESTVIAGLTITFFPTPRYTAARQLWYAAGHVLDTNSAYPDLTNAEASLVMLNAQSLALGLQASAATAEGWKYTFGDESVDKSGLPKAISEQARVLAEQYLAAVRAASGPTGRRG